MLSYMVVSKMCKQSEWKDDSGRRDVTVVTKS